MSGFSGFANSGNMLMLVVWFIVGLFGSLLITAVILMVIGKMKETPIYELDLVTRRFRKLSGREKKYKSGQKLLFVNKIKKWMPQIQQEDKFIQGKNDVILLIKDNNGLHHTARLPSMPEFKKWHEAMYAKPYSELIKESNPGGEILNVVDTIYLMPNPKEDLEWLSDQAVQANKEFATEWWKNPVIMWLGTIFLCAMTFIVTIIVAKRM